MPRLHQSGKRKVSGGGGFRNSEDPPWAIASRVAEYGGRLRIGGGERRGAHLEIEIPVA